MTTSTANSLAKRRICVSKTAATSETRCSAPWSRRSSLESGEQLDHSRAHPRHRASVYAMKGDRGGGDWRRAPAPTLTAPYKMICAGDRSGLFVARSSATWSGRRLPAHRDIKPAHILLSESGKAVLADPGLVRALAPDVTRFAAAGHRVATPTDHGEREPGTPVHGAR